MNAALERMIERRASQHDADLQAAAQLAITSCLRFKIGAYAEADGRIEWDRLAADLTTGLPWSGGELRLARLGCSLAGRTPERLEGEWAVREWSLAELLSGLSGDNRVAALAAITLAAGGAW